MGASSPWLACPARLSGYQDLNALLQIVGQRLNNLASLCRLRGSRQAGDDLALARQAVAQVAGSDNTDVQLIKSWFPEIFPPDLTLLTPAQFTTVNLFQQSSGVLAALSALESGRNEIMSVTPFLNGSANVLGYDPAFFLLAQDNSNPNNPRESYDVLEDMLKDNPDSGSNKPLSVAINKLGTVLPATGAIGFYQNFLDKIERVASDIEPPSARNPTPIRSITSAPNPPSSMPMNPSPRRSAGCSTRCRP